MKDQIEQVAREKGCSFGRAAELILELSELTTTTVGSVQGLIETILFQRMWSPILARAGEGEAAKSVTLWVPPDTPFPIKLEKITT